MTARPTGRGIPATASVHAAAGRMVLDTCGRRWVLDRLTDLVVGGAGIDA
jgi:hypothetical protein